MRSIKTLLCCLLAAACSPGENPPSQAAPPPIVFEGALLITGDGTAPIENSAFTVENDRITSVARKGELQSPDNAAHIDLTGKTVIPALIDDHSHLGYTVVKTMSTAAENFTRENLEDHLFRYAYYGIAATLSMGVDNGEIPYEVRDEPLPGAALFRTAGRGIALPDAGPGAGYRKAAPYGITNEAEAREAVRELAARKADIVKIWVDDRNATVEKLPPPLYRAIIDEAHKLNLRVVAHIFYLADAKELLRSGIDGFAHGVRDRDIDDEFVRLFKERPDVFIIPNLPDRGAMTEADFPWLSETLPPDQIEQMRKNLANRSPEAIKRNSELFGIQARNLARLNAAGVKIGFGTDAGTSVGWNAHTELEDMVAAGMTPAQVLVAATRTAAEILRLDQHGMVAAGKSADFVVLEANPLDDIRNARRIAQVYLRGKQVDRAGMRAAWNEASTN